MSDISKKYKNSSSRGTPINVPFKLDFQNTLKIEKLFNNIEKKRENINKLESNIRALQVNKKNSLKQEKDLEEKKKKLEKDIKNFEQIHYYNELQKMYKELHKLEQEEKLIKKNLNKTEFNQSISNKLDVISKRKNDIQKMITQIEYIIQQNNGNNVDNGNNGDYGDYGDKSQIKRFKNIKIANTNLGEWKSNKQQSKIMGQERSKKNNTYTINKEQTNQFVGQHLNNEELRRYWESVPWRKSYKEYHSPPNWELLRHKYFEKNSNSSNSNWRKLLNRNDNLNNNHRPKSYPTTNGYTQLTYAEAKKLDLL